MSKLRQNGQDQSEGQTVDQGQNPSMGPSNSQAQGQLDGSEETGPGSSLLDEQDMIVDAVGHAFTTAAGSVMASGGQAPAGIGLPGTVHVTRPPITEMLLYLMQQGMNPQRAQEVANCLGAAIQRYFDHIHPGQIFLNTGTQEVRPAVPYPCLHGTWNSMSPFTPAIELMFLTEDPTHAQTVGNAIMNKFYGWEATSQLIMTGLEHPGGMFDVLPPMQMVGGAWI